MGWFKPLLILLLCVTAVNVYYTFYGKVFGILDLLGKDHPRQKRLKGLASKSPRKRQTEAATNKSIKENGIDLKTPVISGKNLTDGNLNAVSALPDLENKFCGNGNRNKDQGRGETRFFLVEKADVKGHTIGHRSGKVEELKTECAKMNQCTAFVYNAVAKYGWFKSSTSGQIQVPNKPLTLYKKESGFLSDSAVPAVTSVAAGLTQHCRNAPVDPWADKHFVKFWNEWRIKSLAHHKKMTPPNPWCPAEETVPFELVDNVIKSKSGKPLNCKVRKLMYSDDPKPRLIKDTNEVEVASNSANVEGDVVTILCPGQSSVVVRSQCYKKQEAVEKSKTIFEGKRPLKIVLFSIDSMSRSEFARSLPKTKRVMEQLGSLSFNGYGVVADGTTGNLGGILTGWNEVESGNEGCPLFEARRGFKGAKHVDEWPWIMHDAAAAGFITGGHVGDAEVIGPFAMRLRGFQKSPFHHDLAPLFYTGFDKTGGGLRDKVCHSGEGRFTSTLNFLKQFMKVYHSESVPQLFVSHSTAIAHDNAAATVPIDGELSKFISDFYSSTDSKDSILILSSDHGQRNFFDRTDISQSVTARLEERSPMLHIHFPKWFRKDFPTLFNNARNNENSTLSPFDVYATLRHLVEINGEGNSKTGKIGQRKHLGTSILQRLSKNRSCADAHIPSHFCTCLNFHPAPVECSTVKLMKRYLTFINKKFKVTNRQCGKLVLQSVTSVEAAKFNEEIFSKAVDQHGRTRQKVSVSKSKLQSLHLKSKKLLRIKFLAAALSLPPSSESTTALLHPPVRKNMVFELTVDSDAKDFSLNGISRSDRYGKDPDCIVPDFPHLRRFCYCI